MDQYTIFDMIYEPYKINKPIRLIELFAGIGSQSKALENLKANFEHWKICEWAIPSILAYKEIHQDYLPNYKIDFSKDKTKEELIDYLFNLGISSNYNEPMKQEQIKRLGETKLRNIYNAIKSENNLVNISTTKGEDLEIVDTNKYDYIMSYSFPCQDLSLAGKQKGMSREGETRSGLLWQVERLLKECKELPQVLLMENVPEVIGQKNIKDFQAWELFLSNLGYKNYVEILNAKDYEIPQNRRRCFMISLLGDYVYNFPQKKKLELKLKDMLEDTVEKKYYLSDKLIKCFLKSSEEDGNFPRKEQFLRALDNTNNKQIATTITCRAGGRPTDNFIIIPEATKKGYAEAHEGDGVYINRPHQKRGVVQKGMIQTLKTSPDCGVVVVGNYSPSMHSASRIVNPEGIVPTVMGNHDTVTAIIEKENYIQWHKEGLLDMDYRAYYEDKSSPTLHTKCNNIKVLKKDLRIRKLTPKECYRLMGFNDIDCERANKVISDSMIYHTAGDSIVVNVLMAIFKMFL